MIARPGGPPALALLALLAACAGAPAPHRLVEADGIMANVRSWTGAAPGAPDVLLIHGASSHSGEFEASLARALGADFRLTAYDRPGMGRTSDRRAAHRTLAAQAQTAAAIIVAENLSRPVLVGHSYGGAVALRVALDRPDLISGLVLLAPVTHPWDGGVSWHYHVSANPLIGPVFNRLIVPLAGRRAVQRGLESAFAPRPVPDDYYEAAEIGLVLLPRALRANGEDMVALNGELAAQAPRYGGIALPVAVLTGAGDRVASPGIHSRALARAVPHARLSLPEDAGHMPQHAYPEIVARDIGWVLDQAAGRDRGAP